MAGASVFTALACPLLLVAAACGGPATTTPAQGPVPSPRSNAAATYDAVRRHVLMYGGSGGGSELWSWDGTRWALRAQGGPGARDDAIMVFDTRRGRTVLMGGRSFVAGGPVIRTDTWEWDGATWTRVHDASAGARLHAAGGFDPARGVTVVFGGLGPQDVMRRDTWEWDGTSWSMRDTAGPAAAAPNGMAFDHARGRLQLLVSDLSSPLGGGRFTSRLYEWDGSTWTQRPGSAPPLSPTQRLITAGAAGGLHLVDADPAGGDNAQTWSYDGSQWRLMNGPQPPRRFGPALALDTDRGIAVLFGGHAANRELGDLWELGASGWVQR